VKVAALKAQNSNQGEASHGNRDKGKAPWVEERECGKPMVDEKSSEETPYQNGVS